MVKLLRTAAKPYALELLGCETATSTERDFRCCLGARIKRITAPASMGCVCAKLGDASMTNHTTLTEIPPECISSKLLFLRLLTTFLEARLVQCSEAI